MWVLWVLCALCVRGELADVESVPLVSWSRRVATYRAEGGLMLGDSAVGARTLASVTLAPLYHDAGHDTALLEMQVSVVQLLGRAATAGADWEGRGALLQASRAYCVWEGGRVVRAILREGGTELEHLYQRAVMSLLQVGDVGERNETDVSGECRARYELHDDSTTLRKTKSGCSGDAAGVVSRRVTRYSLSGGGVREVRAEEVVSVGAARGAGGGEVRARAWLHLSEESSRAPPSPAPHGTLQAALHDLPDDYTTHDLTHTHLGEVEVWHDEEMSAVAALRAAGGEGELGGVLRALAVLRRATREQLTVALRAAAHEGQLEAGLRALGSTATPAAHDTAAELLQLGARPPPDAARAQVYLAALATAHATHGDVVRAVLSLGAECTCPRVSLAALLAGAAGARAAGGAVSDHARELLVRVLSRCRGEACRAPLLALHNLRRADTADLLLEHAARPAPRTSVALAALAALEALPPDALPHSRVRRLLALALRPGPLEVRAAALDLALCRSLRAPQVLLGPAAELASRGPPELVRIFWERAHQLSMEHGEVGSVLRALGPGSRGWAVRAARGTSGAVSRGAGRAGAWSGRLDARQVSADGVLRDARVSLHVREDGAGGEEPALTVQVWARGLDTLMGARAGPSTAGDEGEPTDEVGEVSAGLELAVAGARGEGHVLFQGQGELMSRVWSGAGSEPTSVLRALVVLPSECGGVALCGGAVLAACWRGAVDMRVDGHVQVSLWSRTSRAALEVETRAELQASVRVTAGPLLQLRGELRARAAPALTVHADLDFYDEPALCVRPHTRTHTPRRDVTLTSQLGPRAWRVTRRRRTNETRAGVTLQLSRDNDRACRTLQPHD